METIVGKWVRFEPQPRPKKKVTEMWAVFNVANGARLGQVHWHTSWRRYVFAPEVLTIFEEDCLRDIGGFLAIQTLARKDARMKPEQQAVAARNLLTRAGLMK